MAGNVGITLSYCPTQVTSSSKGWLRPQQLSGTRVGGLEIPCLLLAAASALSMQAEPRKEKVGLWSRVLAPFLAVAAPVGLQTPAGLQTWLK